MVKRCFQILIVFMAVSVHARSQKIIELYAGTPPNSMATPDTEYSSGVDKYVFNVTTPTLTAYIPPTQKANGAAIIVCPGGGYGSLVINREGHEVAKKLMDQGIAAFVLKYRLPSAVTMEKRSIGPLQDAQQSIKIVRTRAREFHIDTSKLGIMGFSAGGHLASSSGVHYDPAVIENNENINLRPDFMILVYPVITMDTVTGHKGSTLNLLGVSPLAQEINYFSNELQVTKQTPPAFLTVAGDDGLLNNSLLFYTALHEAEVSAELHVYSAGQHGFLRYPSFYDWTRPLFNWMKQNKWIY